MIALLLSIVDAGISQINLTHNAYGQISNAVTTTMTPRPTVDNKNILTNSGTPVQITLTGTDPIPGDVLKFSVLVLAQHGTLTSGTTSNSVAYTPNTGFSGTDSFTYKATDGQGEDSNIATVTITVNAPTPRPTVDNKNILTNSGTPVQITLTGTDPIPGDVLKFSVVGDPQHGTITPGTVSSMVFYTPNTGFSGTDSFTYKATDGQGEDSNIATATISVNATPPTANDVTIQTTSGSNVWSGFGTLGGNMLGDAAVARNSDGRLEVFVVGADHALYHKSQISVGGNSWTDWQYLGGFIVSDPTVLANSDGRLEVFVIASNHALYHIFETAPSSSNSWSAFGYLGGDILGNPAVGMNSDGRLELFVIAANHALYHIFETAPSSSNSWSAFGYLGGIILDKTSPAISRNSQGQLQVFVVGPANATFYKFQITPGSSSWTDYVSLGGVVISNPVVATNSDGRLEVFAIGPNHALYHNFQLS
jgi:hypothetical protein